MRICDRCKAPATHAEAGFGSGLKLQTPKYDLCDACFKLFYTMLELLVNTISCEIKVTGVDIRQSKKEA